MKDKVLIVEDELIVARDIRKTIERNGFRVVGVARTFEKALALIEEFSPSLALIDIFLKGNLTGIDLAKYLNERGIPFIYISANSNQKVLEAAKATDPYGFIVKPFREKDLLVAIDIARYRYENNRRMSSAVISEPVTPPVSKSQSSKCGDIAGRSTPMLHIFNLIQQVAPFDTSVLILGESGTGKEGIANCIVQQSLRHNKPYIKINCAAIPAELIEAELFGFEKGAFTGAGERKPGKFEMAANGTILLDEIGEISLEVQAKLLRVLQEKEVQRLGSNEVIKTNVRILAATSKVLEKEVAEGRFRLDLYYRLLVFPIILPPLRDRKEDIPLLIDHFLRYYSLAPEKVARVDAGALQKLLQYDWPGNVRELQHVVERTILMGSTDMIREFVIPAFSAQPPAADGKNPRIKTMDEIERDHILSVLKQCNFKIAGKGGAAEILNLAPSTLNAKMKKLGIKIGYE
jgi:DNA-binding NtrC family response regulator